MNQGITIRGLNKELGDFRLEDIDLDIPKGYVTCLIGNNGAGKTSLLKCILGTYKKDSGSIVFGFKTSPGHVGVIFDECPYPMFYRIGFLSKAMSKIFDDWGEDRFFSLCKEFGISTEDRVGNLSRGMRMKLQTAVMLSHHTDYLVLDEPTAGMDPDSKERFLDMIREYMAEEERLVIISSHQMSDLEKIADYVILMADGRIVLSKDMATLSIDYGMVRSPSDAEMIPREFVVHSESNDLGGVCLVHDRRDLQRMFPDMRIDDASLDEIMVHTMRGSSR